MGSPPAWLTRGLTHSNKYSISHRWVDYADEERVAFIGVTNTPVKTDEEMTRFKRWRLQQGYSLREVADLAGIDKSYVSYLERGERVVLPATKVRLSRRLGARVSDLFELEPLDRPQRDKEEDD